jgi:hypothetical protein
VIDEHGAGQRDRHQQDEKADAEPEMEIAPEAFQRPRTAQCGRSSHYQSIPISI